MLNFKIKHSLLIDTQITINIKHRRSIAEIKLKGGTV